MNVGEVLDGRYELVELIGHGGMGEVWEARDRSASADVQRVALKSLHPHLLIEKELVARFLREAKAALETRYSAHIIEVLDVVHMPSRPPYLVMEYLEGDNLLQVVESEGPLEVTRAVNLVVQACDALDEVHRQELIHRDIKPDNLFVTRLSGGAEWIKLLDFGVVKFSAIAASAPRLTNVGSTIGTPQYMAPEQAMRPDKIDLRVDIYGIGVVLYQLLTGHVPYETDDFQEILLRIARKELVPPREVRPDLSKGLDKVVMRAMAMDPDDRYQSVMDLNQALQPFTSAPGLRGSSTLKTIIEEIPTSVIASFFARQIDTEPGFSGTAHGGVGGDTDPGTPLSMLDSGRLDTDPGTPLSLLESDNQETELINIGPDESSPPRDTAPENPVTELDPLPVGFETKIEESEDDGTLNDALSSPPDADMDFEGRGGENESRGTARGGPGRGIAEVGDNDNSLRALIAATRDSVLEAFPWLTPRLALLLTVGAVLLSVTFLTATIFGLNCLCAAGGDRRDWASLISADEHDAGGEEMVFDAAPDDRGDAWPSQVGLLEDSDVIGEVEVVDHYGGLERREVISSLRSLGPAVSKCLRRSGRRPRTRVRVHFWVHKSGVLAYRRSRPAIKSAAQQCLRRSLRGRRLPRPPSEPFVAIYPYTVPRR